MAEVRQLDLILNLKDQATKELAGFSGKLESMQPAFQKMALAGTAAFIAIGAGIGKTVKDAVNLGESVNAVQVVFKDGAKQILDFGKNAATSVGLANAEFNQMATNTGALLSDTGKPMSEVSDLTIELTKRASDMASVFNTDVSLAMSAINQAIRGETEAIRNFNSDVTDASIEQFALSQGINKSVSEMTFQEKKLLRVQKIMHDTAVTAGDFANTSESLANKQRVLSSTFTDISSTIGAAFLPVLTDILKTVEPIIKQTAEWIKANPELTKNILLAGMAVAGLVAVVGTLGLLLLPFIAGFGLLFSLITLIVIAIAALIAIGVLLWKNWDTIKEKGISAWNALATAIGNVWTGIKNTIATGINVLIGLFNNFIEKVNGIKTPDWMPGVGGRGMNIPKINTIPVNDAIISPNGNIITTDPKDYLIATKTPGDLVGGGGGGVNVVINYPFVLDRNGGDMLADVISQSLRNKLRI